jgi:hypothetical protein
VYQQNSKGGASYRVYPFIIRDIHVLKPQESGDCYGYRKELVGVGNKVVSHDTEKAVMKQYNAQNG